jgi:broad specificity phosphatase PhoE
MLLTAITSWMYSTSRPISTNFTAKHMETIYFIRHAESEANAGYVTFDDTSTVLTKTGKEQARKLSEQLSESPDLIIYSKYIRTQQTAAPTILKFPKVLTEM